MSLCFCEQQEKVQIRKELWRIEDVIAGLSMSKANYKVTISSVTNPGETSATWMFQMQMTSALCNVVQAMWSYYCISPFKLLIIYWILTPWTLLMGKEHTVFTACVFMLHVHIHQIPQRGNLCLQCRRHQCLLCLRARLLWRWDCRSSSTAPTSAPVATPRHFPPSPASSLYATLQPSAVGFNGWVTSATGVNFSLLFTKQKTCLYEKQSCIKSYY